MPSSEIEFTTAAESWIPPSEAIFDNGTMVDQLSVGSTLLEMKAMFV